MSSLSKEAHLETLSGRFLGLPSVGREALVIEEGPPDYGVMVQEGRSPELLISPRKEGMDGKDEMEKKLLEEAREKAQEISEASQAVLRHCFRTSPLSPQLAVMLDQTLPPESARGNPEKEIESLIAPLAANVLADLAGGRDLESQPVTAELGGFLKEELSEEETHYLPEVLAEALAVAEHPETASRVLIEKIGVLFDSLCRLYYQKNEKGEVVSNLMGKAGATLPLSEEVELLLKEIPEFEPEGTETGGLDSKQIISNLRRYFTSKIPFLLASGFLPENVERRIEEVLPEGADKEERLERTRWVLEENFSLFHQLTKGDNLGLLLLSLKAMRKNLDYHQTCLSQQKGEEKEEQKRATGEFLEYLQAAEMLLTALLQEDEDLVCKRRAEEFLLDLPPATPEEKAVEEAKKKELLKNERFVITQILHPASVSTFTDPQTRRTTSYITTPYSERRIEETLALALERVQREMVGLGLKTGRFGIPAAQALQAYERLCQACGMEPEQNVSFPEQEMIPVQGIFGKVMELIEKRGNLEPFKEIEFPFWAMMVSHYLSPRLKTLENFPDLFSLVQGNRSLVERLPTLVDLEEMGRAAKREGWQLPEVNILEGLPPPLPRKREIREQIAPGFVGLPEYLLQQYSYLTYQLIRLIRNSCGYPPLDDLSPPDEVRTIGIFGPTGSGKSSILLEWCLPWIREFLRPLGIEFDVMEMYASRLRPTGIQGLHVDTSESRRIKRIKRRYGCNTEQAIAISETLPALSIVEEIESVLAPAPHAGGETSLSEEVAEQLLEFLNPEVHYMTVQVDEGYHSQTGQKIITEHDIYLRNRFRIGVASFSARRFQDALRNKAMLNRDDEYETHQGPWYPLTEDDLLNILGCRGDVLNRFGRPFFFHPQVKEAQVKAVLMNDVPRNPLRNLQAHIRNEFKYEGLPLGEHEVEIPSETRRLILKEVIKTLPSQGFRALKTAIDILEEHFASYDLTETEIERARERGSYVLTPSFAQQAFEKAERIEQIRKQRGY